LDEARYGAAIGLSRRHEREGGYRYPNFGDHIWRKGGEFAAEGLGIVGVGLWR
jgi:hypothetical protein